MKRINFFAFLFALVFIGNVYAQETKLPRFIRVDYLDENHVTFVKCESLATSEPGKMRVECKEVIGRENLRITALREVISRYFLSSTAKKIESGVIGVGSTLFAGGLGLGFTWIMAFLRDAANMTPQKISFLPTALFAIAGGVLGATAPGYPEFLKPFVKYIPWSNAGKAVTVELILNNKAITQIGQELSQKEYDEMLTALEFVITHSNQ